MDSPVTQPLNRGKLSRAVFESVASLIVADLDTLDARLAEGHERVSIALAARSAYTRMFGATPAQEPLSARDLGLDRPPAYDPLAVTLSEGIVEVVDEDALPIGADVERGHLAAGASRLTLVPVPNAGGIGGALVIIDAPPGTKRRRAAARHLTVFAGVVGRVEQRRKVALLLERQAEVQRTREAHRRMRTLAEHLEADTRALRERVAATLHDRVAQDLAAAQALIQQASAAEPVDRAGLNRAAALLRTVQRRIDQFVAEVNPPILSHIGLPQALEQLMASLTGDAGSVTLQGAKGFGRPSAAVEAAAYWSTQELIRMALRHTPPNAIRVRLSREAGEVRVDVTPSPGEDGPDGEYARVLADRLRLAGGDLLLTPGHACVRLPDLPPRLGDTYAVLPSPL